KIAGRLGDGWTFSRRRFWRPAELAVGHQQIALQRAGALDLTAYQLRFQLRDHLDQAILETGGERELRRELYGSGIAHRHAADGFEPKELDRTKRDVPVYVDALSDTLEIPKIGLQQLHIQLEPELATQRPQVRQK